MCSICNKLGNIYNGYSNIINKSPEVEKLYNERYIICSNCSDKKLIRIVVKTKHYYCNICKCPLDAKLRSVKEHCPNNKW